MKRKPNKWLLGCGIGCGALLLILVVVFGAAFFYLRSTFHGIGVAAESQEALVEAGGEIHDYIPAADGAIPPDRMEIFLGVRESIVEQQARLEAVFQKFPPDGVEEGEGSFLKAFTVVEALADMISPIGEYVATRNEALIQADMGLGEYFYIYSLAYYSFLDHSPEDGPVVTRKCYPDSEGNRLFSGKDAMFGRSKVRDRYRRHMLALLRNQVESIPAAPGETDGDGMRSELQNALDRFESHPGRTAWDRGLPPAIESSLAPYRERLEATYHATTNCFDVPMSEGEGWNRWSD